MLTANYFDDFVTLATSQESASVTSCVHMPPRLLGWAFAEGGPKAPDFHTLFQALGVQCNVSCMKDGLALVGNTAGRREELVEALTAILTAGRLGKQEALRLRGRLQFASGQVFGHEARAALAAVTSHAYGDGASKLSIRAVLALTLHRQLLLSGRPREL